MANINVDDFKKLANKRKSDEMETEVTSNNASDSAEPSAKKHKAQMRKLTVPAHRFSPLKEHWVKLIQPIVNNLNLQIRFNPGVRQILMRTTTQTTDITALDKACAYVKAFLLGFDVDDALALLRIEDLFTETFEIHDVKTLHGDHLSRAIGRIAGKFGRSKYAIENATKTRLVLADQKIHILGSYQNIALARRAICDLIIGAPPSKVYGQLRTYAQVSGRV